MDYVIAETSIAHTYGNVTSFVTDYIKTLFPTGYFKTVHVHSTIAYDQFNVLKNSKKEFFKKSKPILVVVPKVDLETDDLHLGGTYLTQRISNNYDDLDLGNLQPFFDDKNKGISLRYLMNRLKMTFDITVIMGSKMEQINTSHSFKNRVVLNKPLTLPTSLESYVSRDLMELVSKASGVPIYDENGSVSDFLQYLNTNSYFPISYKMKTSRGKDEFFRFYGVNLDTKIMNLSIDDGNKKGFIDDTFTMTFSMEVEFYGTGLYYFFTRDENLLEDKHREIITSEPSKEIVPLFTISNLYSMRLGDGWQLYTAPIYGVDSDSEPDEMDISTLFNNSLMRVIDYHKINSIPIDIFIKCMILKDNRMLLYGKDYEIDFDRMVLITKKVNKVSTYRLIIYANNLYINSLISDILRLDETK